MRVIREGRCVLLEPGVMGDLCLVHRYVSVPELYIHHRPCHVPAANSCA
jgi:hypothetical protein